MVTFKEATAKRERELVRLSEKVKGGTADIQVLFDMLRDPEYAMIAAGLGHIDMQEMESGSGHCCGNVIADSSIRACHTLLENAKAREDDSEGTRKLRRRAANLLVRERPGNWTVERSVNENMDKHMKGLRNGDVEKTQPFSALMRNDAALTVDAAPAARRSRIPNA